VEGAANEAAPLRVGAPVLMTEALPEPAVIAEDKAEVGRRTPPVLLTREPLVLEAVVPVCCEGTISKVMLEF